MHKSLGALAHRLRRPHNVLEAMLMGLVRKADTCPLYQILNQRRPQSFCKCFTCCPHRHLSSGGVLHIEGRPYSGVELWLEPVALVLDADGVHCPHRSRQHLHNEAAVISKQASGSSHPY